MTMLGIPTHPRANPESPSPARIAAAAIAISNIPTPADATCLRLTWLKIGVGWYKISSKARIARLNRQLPKRVPRAKSGSPTKATELTPVVNSGIEVMAARSTSPIHTPPKPVFLAIASPYRASLVPENRIMTRQRRNFNQTKD
jgi:hypothetical protein